MRFVNENCERGCLRRKKMREHALRWCDCTKTILEVTGHLDRVGATTCSAGGATMLADKTVLGSVRLLAEIEFICEETND